MTDFSVRFRTILAFGTVAFPIGMIAFPVAVYIPLLYSGHLGIGLGIVGATLIATRLFDVVTDPLIGIISDRWRPPIGRRRIWLIIGTLTLGGGIYMLFCPPESVSVLYLVAGVSFAYFGLTTLRLPYTAWAAELSTDYHVRTKVSSTTQFFGIGGLLASTLIPTFLIAQSGASPPEIMRAIGWTIIILLPITSSIVFFTVPEPDAPLVKTKLNFVTQAKTVASNGPFMRLSIVGLIAGLGEAFRQSTTAFFARDVVGLENLGQVYFCYFVAGLIMVPGWALLAKKIEKHKALFVALLIVAATNGAMYLVGTGDIALFYTLFIIKGMCFGGVVLLPYSMIADTADVDTADTLDRQQGLFYSVEAMVGKLGTAVGAGLPLIFLGFVGYNSAGETTPESLHALSVTYSFFPAFFVLIGAYLIWNYSLTESKQRELRETIAQKQTALSES